MFTNFKKKILRQEKGGLPGQYRKVEDSPSVHQLIRKLSDPRIRGTDDENDAAQVLWDVIVKRCRRKGHDSTRHPDWDAEDVAQQTFRDLYRKDEDYGVKLGQYRGDSEAEARGFLHEAILNAFRFVSKGTSKKGRLAIEKKFSMEPFEDQENHRLPRYGHLTPVDKKAISDKKLYQEKRKQ